MRELLRRRLEDGDELEVVDCRRRRRAGADPPAAGRAHRAQRAGGAGQARLDRRRPLRRRTASRPPTSGPATPRSPTRPTSGSSGRRSSETFAALDELLRTASDAEPERLARRSPVLRRVLGRSEPAQHRDDLAEHRDVAGVEHHRLEPGVGGQRARPCRPCAVKVLTVASSPGMPATTMSPLSALCCWRATTKSPSRMPASIIESPRTRSMNRSPSPVKSAGSGQHLLDVLLGQDVGAGGDVADERDVAHRPALDDGARRRVAADLDGAGLGGVAPQVAEALERGEVVVHGGGRGEPHGLADLAHRRRVAAVAQVGARSPRGSRAGGR